MSNYKDIYEVYNNPEYILNDIYDENGMKINNILEFYNFLERILVEVMENIFFAGLQESTNKYPLVLIGGKAINQYISLNKLSSSFDFDIHIYDDYTGKNINIATCGNDIVNNINNCLDFNFSGEPRLYLFRLYIFDILKKYGLVTDNEFNHYKNEQLFSFGYRLRHGMIA
jgi:hypothetical protein